MDAMNPTHQWARFFVWASTVGLAACLAWGAWADWNKGRGSLLLAIVATVATYGVHRLYKALFGTVADPRWVRNV